MRGLKRAKFAAKFSRTHSSDASACGLPHYSATAHVTAYPNPEPTLTVNQASAVPTPNHSKVTLLHMTITSLLWNSAINFPLSDCKLKLQFTVTKRNIF